MSDPLRVVHYLNQFFGGIGGEEQAHVGVTARAGSVGPGRLLEKALGDGARIEATLIGGDNFVSERAEEASRAIGVELDRLRPDVVVAGPAFGSGRYGLACELVCKVARERGVPAITAMHPENPGASGARRGLYIVPTGASTTSMPAALEALAPLARRLGRGEIARAGRGGGLPAPGHAPRPRSRAPGLSARARHAPRQASRPTVPVGGAVRRARARSPGLAHRRPRPRPHRHGHHRRARAEGQSRPPGLGERGALSPAHGVGARVALAQGVGGLPRRLLQSPRQQQPELHPAALLPARPRAPGQGRPRPRAHLRAARREHAGRRRGRARAQHRRGPQGRAASTGRCSSPPEERAIVAAQRSPKRSSGSEFRWA